MTDQEFQQQVLKRFEKMDQRFEELDKRLDAEFEAVQAQFDDVRTRMDGFRDGMNGFRDEMNGRFAHLMGTLIRSGTIKKSDLTPQPKKAGQAKDYILQMEESE